MFQDGLTGTLGSHYRRDGVRIVLNIARPIASKGKTQELNPELRGRIDFRRFILVVGRFPAQAHDHGNAMPLQCSLNQSGREPATAIDFTLCHSTPSLGNDAILQHIFPEPNCTSEDSCNQGGSYN